MSEPELVQILRRLFDLEARQVTPDELHELNELRKWLSNGWPEVSSALARAYLEHGQVKASLRKRNLEATGG